MSLLGQSDVVVEQGRNYTLFEDLHLSNVELRTIKGLIIIDVCRSLLGQDLP